MNNNKTKVTKPKKPNTYKKIKKIIKLNLKNYALDKTQFERPGHPVAHTYIILLCMYIALE